MAEKAQTAPFFFRKQRGCSMNIKPSLDTTGDLLEAVDPKPTNAIFSHTHNYTKSVVESYSLHDFDLNVLVQNEEKGNIRTVADETIYKGRNVVPLIRPLNSVL
jgi:hypothetical protein